MASGHYAAVARNLYAEGEEGPIFGPLDFGIPQTGLTVFSGPAGSGRTALSLVLSGRMAPSSGDLDILGLVKDRDVRRHVALAGVPQVDELERSVTVADIVTESKAWAAPWYKRVTKADTGDLSALCAEVYGDRELPDLSIYVSELSALDNMLLRICFALRPAHKERPSMLVVDDIEQLADLSDQRDVLRILAGLAENMAVVVTTVNPLDGHSPPHLAIDLTPGRGVPESPSGDAKPEQAESQVSTQEDDQ